uniref:Igf2-b protein n=1 Tax=Fopius arisanus TaxID=64838 RepID=A0A0C9PVP9_9HYME
MFQLVMLRGMCFFLGFLLLNTSSVDGHPSGERYCARRLVEILEVVCAGRGFNGPMDEPDPDNVPSNRQSSKGIIEECCTAPCTWNDLETYCRPKRKMDRLVHK